EGPPDFTPYCRSEVFAARNLLRGHKSFGRISAGGNGFLYRLCRRQHSDSGEWCKPGASAPRSSVWRGYHAWDGRKPAVLLVHSVARGSPAIREASQL